MTICYFLKLQLVLLPSLLSSQVGELVNEGKESVTWGSPDKEDYLEKVTAVISEDVYRSLTRVHNNWARVEELALSWSEGRCPLYLMLMYISLN